MGETNSMFVKGRMPNEIPQTTSGSRDGEAAVLSMPQSLRIGKTLQGKVISIQGKEIELLLQGNSKIVARLEQNMQVSLNQILNFEVKRTDNSLILRPLFENLGQDANLLKALDEASMPGTQNNLEMVQSLMKKGMPINKQTLNEINRQMTEYPTADGKLLVQMKELNIPITENNVSQFISYKGTNHYLSDALQSVANSVQETLNQLIQEDNIHGLEIAFSRLNKLLFDEEALAFEEKTTESTKNTNESITEEVVVNLKNNLNDKTNENINVNLNDFTEKTIIYNESITENVSKVSVELLDELKKLEIPEEIYAKLQKTEGDLQKIFIVLEDLIKNKDEIPKIKHFFQSDSFQKGIQELLEQRCLLEPKDFAQKEIVKETFAKIREQVDILYKMSEEIGKAGEQLLNSTSSLQNNLDFMNQLNHAFLYLQVPLKKSGQNGTGELFVYAKKKNKGDEQEELSALLHLNMKNIGPLDVHVKMKLKKVETNFYLSDEKFLDFISSHLPELDAAIAKRGYDVNSSIGILKEEKNTMEYLIKKEETEGNYIISNQSFDARA